MTREVHVRSSNDTYIARLDHLRFLAATLVLLYHAVQLNVGRWEVSNPALTVITQGQTGVALPAGIPAQVLQAITAVAQKTFHEGFTSAMRTTLVLPLIVLGLAAVTVLLVRRRPTSPAGNAGG